MFIGPPGAGKGTQSAAIVERHGIPQVSTGDIIRGAIRAGNGAGPNRPRSFADAGKLVPDELVNRLAAEERHREQSRLYSPDSCSTVTRAPRPRPARSMRCWPPRADRAFDHALLLEVDDDVLLERITGRRSDPDTGRVYHVKFDPPPPAEIAARLIQRPDDTEAVFGQRLVEYRDKTAPLIPFYERAGLLLRRIVGRGLARRDPPAYRLSPRRLSRRRPCGLPPSVSNTASGGQATRHGSPTTPRPRLTTSSRVCGTEATLVESIAALTHEDGKSRNADLSRVRVPGQHQRHAAARRVEEKIGVVGQQHHRRPGSPRAPRRDRAGPSADRPPRQG